MVVSVVMSPSVFSCLCVAVLASLVSAYDAPQQPLAPVDCYSFPSTSDKHIDITSRSQFSGLGTYANLPYVNCFVDAEAEKVPYDIAILGAPFDTVSTHPRNIISFVMEICRLTTGS
jgi:agmatinase